MELIAQTLLKVQGCTLIYANLNLLLLCVGPCMHNAFVGTGFVLSTHGKSCQGVVHVRSGVGHHNTIESCSYPCPYRLA